MNQPDNPTAGYGQPYICTPDLTSNGGRDGNGSRRVLGLREAWPIAGRRASPRSTVGASEARLDPSSISTCRTVTFLSRTAG